MNWCIEYRIFKTRCFVFVLVLAKGWAMDPFGLGEVKFFC